MVCISGVHYSSIQEVYSPNVKSHQEFAFIVELVLCISLVHMVSCVLVVCIRLVCQWCVLVVCISLVCQWCVLVVCISRVYQWCVLVVTGVYCVRRTCWHSHWSTRDLH